MTEKKIRKLFADTAYIRTGGSEEELRCANYIAAQCKELGLEAKLEAFEVDMATIREAALTVDGKQITCKGYKGSGNAQVEAELYYLTDQTRQSLANCRGKIVMVDGYLGYWLYRDILENGAVGFITYDGNCNYADRDIDQRELRSYVHKGDKLPGVNINAKDAVKLIAGGAKRAAIRLQQEEYKGQSHNVIAELPGTEDKWIVLTAHYDSTALSQGAYDNMSGAVGLLGIAEALLKKPRRHGLRFIWCGSEERGLLGAKAYVAEHEEALQNVALCINLDMIGCIMGKFIACCTTEEALVSYLKYMGAELGFGIGPYQDVYSSDSTPFADKGIPAVSFARIAPPNTATIHNSYDTKAVMSPAQMLKDIAFIVAFTDRMASAAVCPVERTMPDNMKDKLDIYLCRKRGSK